MSANREIVTDAFRSWADGTGYVGSIFADDMTWEIAGRSVVSRKYANTRQFMDEVLRPFGARFSSEAPVTLTCWSRRGMQLFHGVRPPQAR